MLINSNAPIPTMKPTEPTEPTNELQASIDRLNAKTEEITKRITASKWELAANQKAIKKLKSALDDLKAGQESAQV